jgi:hypothetical protein
MALVILNPIDPASGAIAIEQLTGKPVGTPPPLDDRNRLGEVRQGRFEMSSAQHAEQLGFGFGSISDTARRQLITRDYGLFALQPGLPDSGVDSWTYGAGYRIGILTHQQQVNAQVSLPMLAAAATLQSEDIRFQVLEYGMPGAPPCPFAELSRLDVESYARWVKWEQDISLFLEQQKSMCRPMRVSASVMPDVNRLWIVSAPLRYALERIRDREPLPQALEKAPRLGLTNDEAIRAVYQRILGNPDVAVIEDRFAQEAEKWIRRYDEI